MHNIGSCIEVDHGVVNDGTGMLFGFAWAQNTGWISFVSAPPARPGVTPTWRGTPALPPIADLVARARAGKAGPTRASPGSPLCGDCALLDRAGEAGITHHQAVRWTGASDTIAPDSAEISAAPRR